MSAVDKRRFLDVAW